MVAHHPAHPSHVGAATRAPFAAIVFVFELTRDYDAILPLMLATVLAEIVTRLTLQESLMTEKLARRRITVPGETDTSSPRTTSPMMVQAGSM